MWDFSLLPCTLLENKMPEAQTIDQILSQPVSTAILAPQEVFADQPFDTAEWQGQPILLAELEGVTTAFPVAGKTAASKATEFQKRCVEPDSAKLDLFTKHQALLQ